MENIFDGLVEFPTTKDFEDYLNNLTKQDALKLIELALHYTQKSGYFSIRESHTIYKCLNKLKEYDVK